MDYCNALYAGVCQSSLSRLQLVQNAAARLLTNTKKRDHITPILASLHWLPVKQRIVFKILLFVFKAINGLAPEYIKDLLVVQSFSRLLRSNSHIMLKVPRTRLKCRGDRAFSVVAPRLWNDLPFSVGCSTSLQMFKSRLKTYLYSQAFDV